MHDQPANAPQPPQATPFLPGRRLAPEPEPAALHPMFARVLDLAGLTDPELAHLATFAPSRALCTLKQGATQERVPLGHMMPDFYARAVSLVGAGHITASIEQDGREPLFFAFATQETDDSDDSDAAQPLAPAAAPHTDALALLLAEMREERRAAREREERAEARRELERREILARLDQAKAAPAVDPFTEQLRQKAQELQIKALEKASRALDDATRPEKGDDQLDQAVSVIERLAAVRERADSALSRIVAAPEKASEPDIVDMFERVSANPLAQEVARKFFKLDNGANLAPRQPALNAPAREAAQETPGPAPVDEVVNPFAPTAPGAAANA